MNTTFKFNDAVIEVKPLTIGDELDTEMLADIIRDGAAWDRREQYKRRTFSEFLVSARVVEGDLGFPLPSIDATVDELQDAYAAWLNLSGLLSEWRAALQRVEREKKATAANSTDGSKAKPEAS